MAAHRRHLRRALGDDTDTVEEAVRAAARHGTIVSYDLNFRPSLWNANGGVARAREVNGRLARHVDVMIGNEEDFSACLGLEVAGTDGHYRDLDTGSYREMILLAADCSPTSRSSRPRCVRCTAPR